MAKIDLNIINKAVADKWITKRDHATLPLSIYTYSKRTEIENNWNDITKLCRGLILDDQGNIVGNPFFKFFNIGEQSKEKVCGNKMLKHSLGEFLIPDASYRIYDKMDGSIVYVINYNNDLVIATKGSFESEQAIAAQQLLKDKYSKAKFAEGYTYIFEYIAPQNRIVVDYGKEEFLCLLAIRDNEQNKDLSYAMSQSFADKFDFKLAQYYNKTIEQCLDEINLPYDNREGYVVHFNDGNKLKIKYNSYMQLHRIMTDITSKDILESIEKGESIVDFCTDKNVPDEMIEGIKSLEKEFITQYEDLEDQAQLVLIEAKKLEDRKSQAAYIMTMPKQLQGVVFAMLQGKNYDEYIFKILKNQEKENRKYIGTCAK